MSISLAVCVYLYVADWHHFNFQFQQKKFQRLILYYLHTYLGNEMPIFVYYLFVTEPRDLRQHSTLYTLSSALVQRSQSERSTFARVLSRDSSSLNSVHNFLFGHFDPAGTSRLSGSLTLKRHHINITNNEWNRHLFRQGLLGWWYCRCYLQNSCCAYRKSKTTSSGKICAIWAKSEKRSFYSVTVIVLLARAL